MHRLIVTTMLAVFAAAAAHAQDITLKLSDQFPLTHIVSQNGPQAFMKRVEELIPGRVKFEHYPAQQLAKAVGQFDAVRNGLVDIALVCTCYIPERLPLSTLGELPGLFDDTVKATKAYMELTANELQTNEYDRFDVQPLYVFFVTPYQLMMRSKDEITDVSQLSGLKLRVAGAGGDIIANELGGVGVRIPASDLYLALERGTVDGTIFSTPAVWAYKAEEVLGSWTDNAGLGAVGYVAFIRKDTWNKLPADVQEALKAASADTSIGIAEAYVKSENESYDKLRSLGKTVYHLSPEVKEQFGKRLATISETWVSEMEARNLPAQATIDTFKKYMESVD